MGESRSPAPEAITPEEPVTLKRAAADAFDNIEQARVLAAVRARMFDETAAIRLSRYVLVEKIGEGGMGVVYRAFDPSLERQVAIKAVQTTRRDAGSTARFMREAKALAKFTHPNVVAVHDVGTFELQDYAGIEGLNPHGYTDGEGAFIVMELIDGEDLSQWLNSATRSAREILGTFAKAGQGLAALHDAGLAHRDFKLSNVLIANDGRVCVADFGLAGAVEAPSTDPSLPKHPSGEITDTSDWTRLTQTGAAIGTPAYMSPEQHRGEPADARSDQYAFCVALFRALTGRPPFSATTSRGLLRAKTEQYPPSTGEGLRLAPRVTRAVLRGLHPESRRRFSDMRALLSALGVGRPGIVRRTLRALAWPTAAALAVTAAVPFLRPGSLQLEVLDGEVEVTDYVLTIDGEPAAPGPSGEVELSRGQHFVEVTAAGFRPAARAVEISAGSTLPVTVTVDPIVGQVDVDVEPNGAILEVDGRDYGSRLQSAPLRIGEHDVVARAPGHWRDWFTVEVGADNPTARQITLIPAVHWSAPASGTQGNLDWLEDLDGDGRREVGHSLFATYTVFDPWRGAELHEFQLSGVQNVAAHDFDGDGKSDLALIAPGEDAPVVEVWDLDASAGPAKRRWRTGEVDSDTILTAAELDPSGWRVVLARPATGRVEAYDAVVGGTPRWSASFEASPRWVEALTGSASGSVIVLTDDTVELVRAATGERTWSVDHGVKLGLHPGQLRRLVAQPDSTHASWRSVVVNVPHNEGTRTLVLNLEDGRELWSRPLGGGSVTPDVDSDGQGEVAIGATLYSGRTGAPIHRFRGAFRVRERRAICFAAGLADVTALPSGEVLARRAIPPGVNLVGLDDIDGDQRSEILVGTTDGRLGLLDWDLDVFAIADLEARMNAARPAMDANGDGAPDLLVAADGPLLITGTKLRWQRRALAPLRAGGVLADFDNDGQLDLVVLGAERAGGRVRMLDAMTGRVKWTADEPGGSDPIRPPAALCDAEGRCDVVLPSTNALVRLSGRDGKTVATFDAGEVYASPLVADIDGDGGAEILAVTWERQRTLWVLEQDLRPRHRIPLPQGSFGPPLLHDVDGDGHLDAVLSLIEDRAAAVSLRDPGRVLWDVRLGGWAMHPPTPVSMPDGQVRYAFATRAKELVFLDAQGKVVLRQKGFAWGASRPAAADVDGDGRDDLFVPGPGATLRRLDAAGNVAWTQVVSASAAREELLPASALQLADLDGDGQMELVSVWEDGMLNVVAAQSGAPLWSFRAGDRIEAPPMIGDVDGDGIAELFVASHDRALYGLGARPASLRSGREGGVLAPPESSAR